MKNQFKVAKYAQTDSGFVHSGYDEYVITYGKAQKVHQFRIIVNGRYTEHKINLLDCNSGYKNIMLKAISDYKNNRLKGNPNDIVKKTISLDALNQIYSKTIIRNVKNYLLSINKEERRDTLTKYELI
jgi:hypothetical protein